MKKLIIATGLLLGSFFAQAQVKGVKHVILIGMDGFGAHRRHARMDLRSENPAGLDRQTRERSI
ncbi:hypothetical protein [Chitinophaga sp. 212800010-3]|uniref:hypothetical protein n=1 Tax=unclassified Chitinophaga TaxID=2619133 RepID=UPI002DEEFEC5|nr:hypothetical protein [Chitinophaga sp. 212800010-3]